MQDNKGLIIFALLLLFALTGCAANGPLLRPDMDSRREYIKNNPKLSAQIKQAILEGRVIKGMAKEEVRVILGEPDKISYVTKDKTSYFYTEAWDESWYYKDRFFKLISPSAWVIFKDETVVEIDSAHWYDK